MNILITILARAGSKGVPNKHTRLIADKPLIWWTVNAAINWRLTKLPTTPVAIGSNSHEIFTATGYLSYPLVSGYYRSPKHVTDTAPKVPAIQEVVQMAEKDYSKKFDIIIDLDATAPIRTTDDIDGALALFQFKQPDCVMSCTVGVGRNPYFNLLELRQYKDRNYPDQLMRSKPMDIHNRQEAPDVYEANSSIYVYSRDFLFSGNGREGVQSPLDGYCIPYVMPDESFWHVDTELDFKIVDFLLKERHGTKKV